MVASIITEYHRQQNSYNSMYQESSLLPPLFFVLITVTIIIVIILTIALITIFPSFPPQSRFLIGYASDLAIYLISSFKDNARNQWERCNLTFLLSLKVTFISHPFLLPLIIWYLPPKEIACVSQNILSTQPNCFVSSSNRNPGRFKNSNILR